MKTKNNILESLVFLLFLVPTVAFAQDDELNRSVTVERDFQPVIQAAGKVATKPAVVETTIEPEPVKYSTYTADVTPNASIDPMLSQPTRFEPGKEYDGYIRGAIGHPNTLFDFGYHLDDGKKSILDVYAHHKAEWGLVRGIRHESGLSDRLHRPRRVLYAVRGTERVAATEQDESEHLRGGARSRRHACAGAAHGDVTGTLAGYVKRIYLGADAECG